MTSPTESTEITYATWSKAAEAGLEDQDMRERMTAPRTNTRLGTTGPLVDTPEYQTLAKLDILIEEWDRADRWRDSDLKIEAEQARRQQKRELAATITRDAVTQIATAAAKEADAAGKDLGQYLFRVETTDVAASSATWQNAVLPTLESGPAALTDWQRIIATAGPDELAAIMRYGRAWVRRNVPKDLPQIMEADTEQRWAGIVDAIQRRHIATHPSDNARTALARSERARAAANATGRVAAELTAGRIRDTARLSMAAITLKSSRFA